MHISAIQIAEWAKTSEAKVQLPRLIRRLIYATSAPSKINFPSGESTSLPGWDGELETEHESAWIPSGKSLWEFSCEAAVTTKANKDYEKRTKGTIKSVRLNSNFIFVSACRWNQKKKWLVDKKRGKKWSGVCALDADDLEQWLEQSPTVALQFAEELGLTGPGVESLDRHWQTWSGQSDPAICVNAFLKERENTRERFIQKLSDRLEKGLTEPIAIKADSVNEASAFVSISLLNNPNFCATSLVVTDANGWRFVEKNLAIRVAIAVKPEVAEKPTIRTGLVVIIPYAAGDMSGHFRGVAGRERNAELTLERPRIESFEKALITLGIDESEAGKLSKSTGRSWSVFRRRHAVNPSIRMPEWLEYNQVQVLSTLCLIGAWSSAKEADKEIVSRLAGRIYEDIERNLRHLAQLDDSPVLEIGTVWKAKSPLELLDIFGNRITGDEIDRFFDISRQILLSPDPALELPEEDRFAAQIYGKVRPESELLISAICDSLIKLAVRGQYVPALAAANIESRVNTFVKELLLDSNETRWLSLATFLPFFAEAGPDAFLNAVEKSLLKPKPPVAIIFTETKGSSFMGRCWYAPLLWALEILAWNPRWLPRVVLVIAQLTRIEIKANWANSPKSTLLDIFRSWLPQTSANIDERIAIIDTLIAKEPEIAFDLLDGLVHVGSDHATPSVRPRWRDDDANHGYVVTQNERMKMVIAAADRLISCSKGNSRRIARLIGKIEIFDKPRLEKTLELAAEYASTACSDDDKEVIRTGLREKIYWHRNYDDKQGEELDLFLRPFENLYERLMPTNVIVRYKWLFSSGRPNLPIRVRDDDFQERSKRIEIERLDAVREIYSNSGIEGIEQLAGACESPQFVGITLSSLGLGINILSEWILKKGGGFENHHPLTMILIGLLRALDPTFSVNILKTVLDGGTKIGWEPMQAARLLSLARAERQTWDIAKAYGYEIDLAYWSSVSNLIFFGNEPDIDFALNRLLEAKRPRTAFRSSRFAFEKMDPRIIVDMLERILNGEEPEGPLFEHWDVIDAVERIESSSIINKERIIPLEFMLIPILGYGNENRVKTLYIELMSNPEVFAEIIRMLYKPAHGDRPETQAETEKTAFNSAWHLLRHCHRLPGARSDGSIDPDEFIKFIDEARKLCQESDRLKVCDQSIGEILAHAPSDLDGIWPTKAVGDLLDRPELEDIRHGFMIGVHNKRGITSRSYDEGGDQERSFASKYQAYANSLRTSHPIFAATLDEIARSYESEGQREDLRAKLLQEKE